MKRKVRIHYSTEIFPCEIPRKQRESEETEINEAPLESGDGPLREVVREEKQDSEKAIEIVGKEEATKGIAETIAERLRTNPIQLLKKAKENQYGNFHSYYDHRCEKKWNDPRLRVLSRDWFLNKDVLDIGCNDGSFTMQIAIKYFPYKIQGIDIDQSLVSEAISNLLFLEKQQAKSKKPVPSSNTNEKESQQIFEQQQQQSKEEKVSTQVRDKLSRLPKSFLIDHSKNSEKTEGEQEQKENAICKESLQIVSTNSNSLKKAESDAVGMQEDGNSIEIEKNPVKEDLGTSEVPIKADISLKESDEKIGGRVEILKRFPENVRFRLENYIESMDVEEKYDTICCFSTTKWIHLNFGDEGIKRLFDKVHQSLRVNGLFILEAQEWRSYKKKSNYLSEFREVIKSIKIHPGQFKAHLIETYNYVLEAEITPQVNTEKVQAFFKRPLLIFRKQDPLVINASTIK